MSASQILQGKGYRVASKALGDDTTRSRFVRVAHDEVTPRKRRRTQPRLPGMEAAFIQEGRTKFSKAVKLGDKNILVSGHNNIKIGRDVRKGRLRGYWIYTLSLEERKTCPTSCQHWQNCYGNNMPFAKRVDHTAPDFLKVLEAAVDKLCAHAAKPHTVAKGILVRLHALGDFYSLEYVWFWRRMLKEHPNLALYGYTARERASLKEGTKLTPQQVVGTAVAWLNYDFPEQAIIRFSNGGMDSMSTASIGSPESCPPDAFICPEQTGKTLGCDTCGLCWGTTKNVAFLEH